MVKFWKQTKLRLNKLLAKNQMNRLRILTQKTFGKKAPNQDLQSFLSVVVLGSLLMLLALMAFLYTLVWMGDMMGPEPLWILGVIGAFTLMAYLLAKRGHWRFASAIPIAVLFSMGIIFTQQSGFTAPVALLFTASALLAVTFQPWFFQAVVVAACILVPIFIDIRHFARNIQDIFITAVPYGIMLGSISLLQWYTKRKIITSLHSAEELAEALQQQVQERDQAAQAAQQAAATLQTIAESISTATGQAFFESLVVQLTKTLNVNFAFVGKVVGPNANQVQTLAFCRDGELQNNFSYPLPGTPCQTVVGKTICVYPENVQQLFPDDNGLKDMGVQCYMGVPLFNTNGQALGLVVVMSRRPVGELEQTQAILRIFAGRAAGEMEREQAEIALQASTINQAELLKDLEKTNQELEAAYTLTLEGWAKALALRDKETEDHSREVVSLTMKMAKALGVPEEQLIHIERGALLHDIGKVGIPDAILLKPGPLTDKEMEIMRMHPVYAHEMLSQIPYLQPALDIPCYHHERYDGSGYPFGIQGKEIPLAARIFAVVDVWSALRSNRPYRMAYPKNKALEYILNESGKHFDPEIVQTFLNVVANTSSLS